MALGPSKLVDAPAPQPPRYTLVGAAQGVDETDERWINGVSLRTYPCGPALAFGTCSPAGSAGVLAKSVGNGPNLISDVQPVSIYFPMTCQLRYGAAWQDLEGMARVSFAAYEYAAFEREFWTGAIEPTNPHLASGTTATGGAVTVLNGGVATSIRGAMGLLEGCIAKSGQRGMIHCTTAVGSDFVQAGGASDKGGVLVTPLGTILVPGAGYPGTSPDGVDPGGWLSWAYATTMVQYRRAANATVIPTSVEQGLDRVTNTVRLDVERPYMAAFDYRCLLSAVLIDRSKTTF
jgi:hypothetical protein